MRIEVLVHVDDDERVAAWEIGEAIGPEVIAWNIEEVPDCPIIVEGSCPSCGRWLDPVSDDLQPACGDCAPAAL